MNEAVQPDVPPSVTSVLVDRYLRKLDLKSRRFFDKIIFEQPHSYYISIKRANGLGPDTNLEQFGDDVLQNFSPEPLGSVPDEEDPNLGALSLILCEASSNSPNAVPLTRNTFVTIMDELRFPSEFFQAFVTGTSSLTYHPADSWTQCAGFILRTPMSGTENWTLALSWNAEYRALRGIIHGLQGNERTDLVTYLGNTREEAVHPMNLPLVLCEMLTEADLNGVKKRAMELCRVEIRTYLHDYPGNKSINDLNSFSSSEQDFDEMTRSLNIIISRLAFHEMRIQANALFTDQILECIQMFENSDLPLGNNSAARQENWKCASRRLRERLAHLKIEHRGLLLEVICNQKIAQSQLEIVYNLVAQRDNKDNLKLAKVSMDIANVTKDDSFAMRTVAIMSIAFLPGTFVSSFFSMGMFNWQAPKGTSVLSSRFWVYWAVTGPLTLSVFATWYFWLRKHREHEKYRLDSGSPARMDIGRLDDKTPEKSRDRPWYRKLRLRVQQKDEEKRPAEEGASAGPSLAADPGEPA